jgi:hypothetical protein
MRWLFIARHGGKVSKRVDLHLVGVCRTKGFQLQRDLLALNFLVQFPSVRQNQVP